MSLDFLYNVAEFKGLTEAILKGERGLTLAGLPEAARPYVLACLAARLPRRLVTILPSSAPLDTFAEQCRFFLSYLAPAKTVSLLPGLGISPYQEIPPSLEVAARRMRFFHELLHRPADLILTDLFGLLKPFPSPRRLAESFLRVEKGGRLDRDKVLQTLLEFGYSKEELIASRGEFAWRGGVVDVFSPWEGFPFRLEFSGDSVVSIRAFEPSSQASLRRLDRAVVPSLREFPGREPFFEEWADLAQGRGGAALDVRDKADRLRSGDIFPSFVFLSVLDREQFAPFRDYLQGALFLVQDFEEVDKEWLEARTDFEAQARELEAKKKFVLPVDDVYAAPDWARIKEEAVLVRELAPAGSRSAFSLGFQSVPRFTNNIPFFLQYLKKLQAGRDRCYLFLSGEALRQRFGVLLAQEEIVSAEAAGPMVQPRAGEVILLLGSLSQGFGYPEEKIYFFSEHDVLTEERVVTSRLAVRPFRSHFQDLKTGDFVVHSDYGIGLFQGLLKMEVEGKAREFIDLRYRDEDKLYVPVENLNLVQKYSAAGEAQPSLDKLGSLSWERTKQKAKKAIEQLAQELLDLYAQRKSVRGFAFSSEGPWQSDFEKTFEFEETEDQHRSIQDISRDMESPFPMDRLLCGDVGYGKTEVAMRAAFKAVMSGKQVAVLCPTTILASQHVKTFRNRMLLFPVRVEGLTRLQSAREQKKILADLPKGLVDVVIGTHRLLSRDVVFRDLGLLIVDEEQRFGVRHKEKIKQLKTDIDVLTLTATPIPRTLNLSLAGLHDISLIETPPRDRLAVHTVVTTFSPKLVAAAVRQELKRGGQVYYIHNRIEDIEHTASVLGKLVPEAKLSVIHGQMPGLPLEKRMLDFITQKSNVLVSTTIIENGIDIPLVNTLIVDRADLYGLAQLYQLRGRVGRSSRQAFAYFLVPPFTELTPLARKRLGALKEFSELGSGFRLAAKDLEIRGAGTLLGFEQHGNLAALGYDYFMHLLEQAIRQLKGEAVEEVKTEINLKADILIPEDYLPQVNLRLHLYKRISSVESLEELDRIGEEMRDRFGPPPPGAKNLLVYGAIKLLARRLRLKSLDRFGPKLVLKFGPSTPVVPSRLPKLLHRFSGSLTPQGVMTVSLKPTPEEGVLNETLFILKELGTNGTMTSPTR
jgi:transcription-repair coupling factor (superfamily II helicase)